MPICFRVDAAARCVFVTGESPVVDDDLTRYQQELATHPDHGPGFHQLVDLRAVDGAGVTAAGVRFAGSLTDAFAPYLRDTRCAVVVSEDLAFGMARVFGAHASEALEVGVFHEIEEARAWIGLDEGGASAVGSGNR
jgi:hypothetical protein